jgi:hypothetical protein
MYASPEFTDFTGAVLHIDPSGRGKDETAYCVTKFLNGMVFIRRWGGFQDGYSEETLVGLADIAAEEQVKAVVVETNFGDGMFEKLFEPVMARRGYRCPVEGQRVSGQKEARIIATLEPVLKQHRLVMDTAVVRADLAHPDGAKRGLYQLTHITNQRGALKHDDRLDVLAQCVGYWTTYLNRDVEKAESEWKQKQAEKWEKEFFRNARTAFEPDRGRERRRGAGRRLR